jgi:SAM-dependent methyltransferase
MNQYLLHKKPISSEPSKFIVDFIHKYKPSRDSPILDVGCGYGRNSMYLAELGYEVIAIDIDDKSLNDNWNIGFSNIHKVQIDVNDAIPFEDDSFGAIIVVHFYCKDLFKKLRNLVRKNGFIVYESVSSHGNNWKDLSVENEIVNELGDQYKILFKQSNVIIKEQNYEKLKLISEKEF